MVRNRFADLMADEANRLLVRHFGWMVALGVVLSVVNSHHLRGFDIMMSVAGLIATVRAIARIEPVNPMRLTHWDEAMGFCALHFATRFLE
jgi:hypothetical protein